MRCFSLDDDLVGLYAHATKVTDWRNKTLTITGDRYGETKGLPLRGVVPFIERDIYLSIRRGYLPPLEYSVTVNPEPINAGAGGGHVCVAVIQCASDDTSEVEFGIGKILTAYNRERFSLRLGRLETESRRFDYSVEFLGDYLEGTMPPPIPPLNGEAA